MMASPEVADSRASLRRFRAANKGAGAKIRPAWTVGDDSDDEEGNLTLQNAPRRKKFRRELGKRQAPYDGEFGGEFREPPFRPRPPPASVTATGDRSSGMPEPTSFVESITASLSEATDSTTTTFVRITTLRS